MFALQRNSLFSPISRSRLPNADADESSSPWTPFSLSLSLAKNRWQDPHTSFILTVGVHGNDGPDGHEKLGERSSLSTISRRNKRGYVFADRSHSSVTGARGHCAIVALQRPDESLRPPLRNESSCGRHKQLWQMPGYVNRLRDRFPWRIVSPGPWSARGGKHRLDRF